MLLRTKSPCESHEVSLLCVTFEEFLLKRRQFIKEKKEPSQSWRQEIKYYSYHLLGLNAENQDKNKKSNNNSSRYMRIHSKIHGNQVSITFTFYFMIYLLLAMERKFIISSKINSIVLKNVNCEC